ncbi:hypothetical protein [Azospirillum sp. ST 5-10]|uniref:hypothetical protein n=1 Tax=unclassified Azospirillum TaxID=2630922 RepID=UPI003F4A64F5
MRHTTPADAARAMAELMGERAAAGGCCTEDDLLAAGYSREDIARHGDAARALARRRGLDHAA